MILYCNITAAVRLIGSFSIYRASQSWPRPPQPSRAAGAIARCFFDFLIPLPAKTPSFESISGRQSSKKALKTRCFTWEGYEKVKKALHRSEVRATFAVKTHIICTIWNSSADPGNPGNPADPAEVVSRSAARTPPSTRAGGQDDGSLNKLPQISEGHIITFHIRAFLNVIATHIFV